MWRRSFGDLTLGPGSTSSLGRIPGDRSLSRHVGEGCPLCQMGRPHPRPKPELASWGGPAPHPPTRQLACLGAELAAAREGRGLQRELSSQPSLSAAVPAVT